MMHAQYISAQAFNSGGLGLVHSLSHAVSAFYDSHHGLNNAIALPRVWEYNLPSRFERYAEIAALLGVDTSKMTTVQAADAAVEEAIRLSKDLGIPDNFGQLSTNSYEKNRMNTGKYEGRGESIDTSEKQIRAIAEHMMGDWCTPGQPPPGEHRGIADPPHGDARLHRQLLITRPEPPCPGREPPPARGFRPSPPPPSTEGLTIR